MARSGHRNAHEDYPDDETMSNHIEAVWNFFTVLLFLFFILTVTLCFYHAYLITAGQTTWEHSGRFMITYLRPYKHGQNPFYRGLWGNITSTCCHGDKVQDWKLIEPAKLRDIQGFNICDNEYWSCC